MTAERLTFRLGSNLALPVDAVTRTFAILGIRGSGKTNTGVDLVEEIVKAGYVACVIDPLDVWWGLRSSPDGKSPGLPIYVLGGKHGDLPLEATSGQLVARLIIEKRVPLVLSMKHLTHADQARFMTDFAIELYRHNDEPLHVVIDEAARFVPQNLTGRPELARCVGAVQDLGAEGRASGIGFTVIGQRASRVNKDILTQCETLIEMRTQSPQDRKALDEWVEAHGTPEQRDVMMSEIATLPTGVGYFWSPEWLGKFEKVHFRARETFDSSRTPEVGKRVVTPKAFAAVDLDALRGEIASTIERAKANDPATLRAEINRLRAQIKQLEERQPVSPAPAIEKIEVPVLSEATLTVLAQATEILRQAPGLVAQAVVAAATDSLGVIEKTLYAAREPLARDLARATEFATAKPRAVSAAAKTTALPAPATPVAQNGRVRSTGARPPAIRSDNVRLKAGAVRMLQQLARCGGSLTKQQLATLADINKSSGTFSDYLRVLREAQYAEDDGRIVTILEAGAERIGETIRRAPPSTTEIVGMYGPKLKAGARRMLDILVRAYPHELPKGDLAERAEINKTSGTFSDYVRALRVNGLLDDRGRNVRASDTLFVGAGDDR